MIRIDRHAVPQPDGLAKVREAELTDLRDFFSQTAKFRRQRKPDFDLSALSGRDLMGALRQITHDKCAYCESPLRKDAVVDQFRPRRGAIRAKGRIDADHYWWLTYDWQNQLPSCYTCSRNKGNRFPIERRAAEPEQRGDELRDERPLLIDPSDDFPEEHLWVDSNGEMLALTDRGAATVEVLDLNRDRLVKDRRTTYEEAYAIYVGARSDLELDEDVRSQLGGSLPYTLARRSAYEQASETAEPIATKRLKTVDYPSLVQQATAAGDEIISGPATWIQGIEARNFLGLRNFQLQFPTPTDSEQEPWLILLGKNGIGKSSLLKAVALALASPAIRQHYYPDASIFLNRETSERSGYVRVVFNRGEPVELGFRKWNKEFTATQEPPGLNLLGYGATRLPPPLKHSDSAMPARFRVGNLFDPWEVLSDAEKWLTDTSQVDSEQFGRLSASLRELLDLELREEIIRYRRKIYIKSEQARVPLRQLSDGYQSVVALAMDIMLNLAHDWSLMETAEGTVLLDEIEVHLHPQWKVNIVRSLRRLFPKLRFIATTHDPLCLTSALPGELHILERNEDGIVEAFPLDIPPGTRADQVLTGDWFGLSTTLDKETIDLMEEHRHMLLLPKSRQDAERRDELVHILKQRLGTYADTSIDQMALDAAAQVIGEQDIRELDANERKQAREAIVRMVREEAG